MSQFVDLNDGRRMPAVGLGTFQANYGLEEVQAEPSSVVIFLYCSKANGLQTICHAYTNIICSSCRSSVSTV